MKRKVMEEEKMFEVLTDRATRCIIEVVTTFTDVRCLASCVSGIAAVAPRQVVLGALTMVYLSGVVTDTEMSSYLREKILLMDRQADEN